MNLRFFETSALGRAFFADEDDHSVLLDALTSTTTGAVTSVLVRLEFVSTCGIVSRSGRIRRPDDPIKRLDALVNAGQLDLIAVELASILPTAERMVRQRALRTLDALHLATALQLQASVGAELTLEFVTRDETQAGAARAEGLLVL